MSEQTPASCKNGVNIHACNSGRERVLTVCWNPSVALMYGDVSSTVHPGAGGGKTSQDHALSVECEYVGQQVEG
jgi:hypothetical protein